MQLIDFNQMNLELEHEIKHQCAISIMKYGDAVREDALQAINELRPDIESWIMQLSQRTIACYELEGILEAKKSDIQFPRLKEMGLNCEELDEIKNDILRTIAKSIMNLFLNSLFRSNKSRDNSGFKKETLF